MHVFDFIIKLILYSVPRRIMDAFIVVQKQPTDFDKNQCCETCYLLYTSLTDCTILIVCCLLLAELLRVTILWVSPLEYWGLSGHHVCPHDIMYVQIDMGHHRNTMHNMFTSGNYIYPSPYQIYYDLPTQHQHRDVVVRSLHDCPY